jgi:hypothetical protein
VKGLVSLRARRALCGEMLFLQQRKVATPVAAQYFRKINIALKPIEIEGFSCNALKVVHLEPLVTGMAAWICLKH